MCAHVRSCSRKRDFDPGSLVLVLTMAIDSEKRKKVSIGTIVILTVSLLLLVYLTVALLRPEKF